MKESTLIHVRVIVHNSQSNKVSTLHTLSNKIRIFNHDWGRKGHKRTLETSEVGVLGHPLLGKSMGF